MTLPESSCMTQTGDSISFNLRQSLELHVLSSSVAEGQIAPSYRLMLNIRYFRHDRITEGQKTKLSTGVRACNLEKYVFLIKSTAFSPILIVCSFLHFH